MHGARPSVSKRRVLHLGCVRSASERVGTHVGDDAVKRAPRVPEAVHARRELAEVARRFGDDVVVEPEGDAPRVRVVDRDVEL